MNLMIYSLMLMMTLFSMFTPNLYFMWMFLEISSLSLSIYLNINSFKIYSIMYFLISSISSILIIFSILNYSPNMNMNYILMFSLWLKLGLFPLNTWMNFMMNKINYKSLLPLLTIIKIIPIIMLLNFTNFNLNIFILLTLILFPPVILSINTSSYPLLLNYSSMYNIPLMLIFSFFNLNFMMSFLLIYMISTIMIILMLKTSNVYYKNSLNLNLNHKNKLFYNMMMFMYSQLPPFSTFILKWNLINFILNLNFKLSLLIMMIIFSSLIMTFNYLNFNNISYFLSSYKIGHKINQNKNNNIKFQFIMSLSLMSFTLMFIYLFMD
uniref:NADH-ubiquinone oxidoreductase chain 2 n=1 Tax=Lasioglossum lativentre TaxID=88531 RepID=A0A0S2LTU9_9HYME|nr:NADH dehydrogenase subunit 2 [Lasioglossum lativentre]